MSWSCVIAALAGCAAPDAEFGDLLDEDAPTFADFEATHFDPETGIYIVDGDIPIRSRDDLYAFWETHVQRGVVESPLAVRTVDGRDASWRHGAQWMMDYCVSPSFGGNHAAVVEAMARATRAWEDAAGVDFRYDPAQDGRCDRWNEEVLFDVQPWVNPRENALATAFSPHEERNARSVLIAAAAFNAPVGLSGILRHELGHAIGFRHEHTRPEAGTCFEDGYWRALTGYDAASVMHYPQCNGRNNAQWWLTPRDRNGANRLYGAANDYQPRLNDYQGDGRADLLCHDVTSGDKFVDFADGSGRLGGSDWFRAANFCNHATGQLLVGDFNGDNFGEPDDLLCHDTTSGFKWIDYASGGIFNGTDWQRDARFCYHDDGRMLIGDFNGDGRDDWMCYDVRSGAKWIDFANGSGQFLGADWFTAAQWCNHDTGRLHIGDFNGDGRDDLLCHDHDTGQKWVDYANASGQFLGTEWYVDSQFCGHNAGRLFVGDFNGDGRDDLLCHDVDNGTKWIDFADGAGRFSGTEWTGFTAWCYQPEGRLFIGDINGDGRDDLLCHDVVTGMKWIDYADGSGRFGGTDWSVDSRWCLHPGAELH